MKICPKIFKVVLTGLIAFAIFSIANVAKSRAAIRIPDDVAGPPYLLDQAGETYILTQDIAALGTAIIIAASGITIDLNSHTITYGTSSGISYGITASGYNINTIIIKNGVILQGQGNGLASHAIYLPNGGSDHEIYNLNITVQGPDTSNIYTNWAGPINIHHCTLYDNNIVISNRHSGPGGMIELNRNKGGTTSVHDCKLYNGPWQGIRITQYSNTYEGGFKIYNNYISHKSTVANAYAISAWGRNSDVYNNTIIAEGRGIHIGYDGETKVVKGGGYWLVHDNYVDVKERPNAEYNPYWVHGIKFEDPGSKVLPNCITKIYNNTIIARAELGFSEARALDISNEFPDEGVEVYNNNITAITTTSQFDAKAFQATLVVENSGLYIHHNTFTSNGKILSWAYPSSGILFDSNILRQGANPINNYTINFWTWGGDSINNILLNTTLENGASLDSTRFGANTNTYYVKWYLDVVVKDSSGLPINGASVMIQDCTGATAYSGTTDASGIIPQQALTQYFASGTSTTTPTKTFYTPHTITVAKDGYETSTQEITMNATKSLTVMLTPGGVPPAREMGFDPEVKETFELETVGEQPSNWMVVDSAGGVGNYDALWRVVDLGSPFGKVVFATTVHDDGPGTWLSHLAYTGTTSNIINGAIPRTAHYYAETLLHMKEDVSQWANEHTLQGIVQSNYNLEVLIWSGTDGSQWGLRLYSNGGEGWIADWGRGGAGITDNTGQTGWDWWARVGMDINLRTKEVSVYYNGQKVIGPIVVNSIATKALASGEPIRTDVRTTNNLMDADDFRIYLIYVSDAPFAHNQSVSTDEDTQLAITLTAYDVDGDTLTYSIVTNPSQGTLSGTPPNVTYNPYANYNGSDSFTFKANDRVSDSNIATVSITVNPVNDTPVLASIGDKSTDEGSLLEFTVKATDVDGDKLTYLAAPLPMGATFTNKGFCWRPTYKQSGKYDVKFTVDDGRGGTDSEMITITVNDIPSLEEDFASDLNRVKTYPNPYRGDKHNQIIFDNLAANVQIKIYTPTGELVREIKEQEGDKAYWDVKNKQGEAVSSGTYIYYITNLKGQEKKGKIAIIR